MIHFSGDLIVDERLSSEVFFLRQFRDRNWKGESHVVENTSSSSPPMALPVALAVRRICRPVADKMLGAAALQASPFGSARWTGLSTRATRQQRKLRVCGKQHGGPNPAPCVKRANTRSTATNRGAATKSEVFGMLGIQRKGRNAAVNRIGIKHFGNPNVRPSKKPGIKPSLRL